MLDSFRELLAKRFLPTDRRFMGFAGRSRMYEEYLRVLEAQGVFDVEFLPASAREFLATAYCVQVPFHGPCHVMSMLLTARVMLNEGHQIPPIVVLAIAGHDAGHNGDGSASPEVLSAAITADWLSQESRWLEELGIVTTGRFGGKADIQAIAPIIQGTRFPHQGPSQDGGIAWMRWFDTLRIASGASAAMLDKAFGLGCELTFFRAFLLECLGLGHEIAPPDVDPKNSFLGWLERGQVGFFLDRNVIPDVANGNYYPPLLSDSGIGARLNRDRLFEMLQDPSASARLLELWAIFCEDITVKEFVQACRTLKI